MSIGTNWFGIFVDSIMSLGKHGFRPPLQKIAKEIELWFAEHYPTVNRKFKVSVSCRRIPVNDCFYGVDALRIPPDRLTTVELRVRLRGELNQWQVFLACGDVLTAKNIFSILRPEAMQYLERYEGTWEKRVKDSSPNPHPIFRDPKRSEKNRKATSESRMHTEIQKMLSTPRALAKLCGSSAYYAETDGSISKTNFARIMSTIVLAQLNDEAKWHLTYQLVFMCIVDPIPDRPELFMPKSLFWEYVEEYHKMMTGSRQRALERQIVEVFQKIQGIRAERGNLLARIRLAEEKEEKLNNQLASLGAEKAEVDLALAQFLSKQK
ncbi:MAG: hypothetical protein WC227_01570 [Patescibacteria group bacterium]|jgi:hypothetical protein